MNNLSFSRGEMMEALLLRTTAKVFEASCRRRTGGCDE